MRQASLSKSSNAWLPRDMIDGIVSICHIKWYIIICWNKYYTEYVNNIKVIRTNKWADKAVAWYRIGPKSSIVVIKQRNTAIPCHVRSMVVHMRLYSLRGDNVVPSSLPKCHVVVIIQPPIKLSSTTSIYGVKVKIYKGCRRNTLYESKLSQHMLRTMPLNNIKKKKWWHRPERVWGPLYFVILNIPVYFIVIALSRHWHSSAFLH